MSTKRRTRPSGGKLSLTWATAVCTSSYTSGFCERSVFSFFLGFFFLGFFLADFCFFLPASAFLVCGLFRLVDFFFADFPIQVRLLDGNGRVIGQRREQIQIGLGESVRLDRTIHVDDELLYRDGEFVLEL